MYTLETIDDASLATNSFGQNFNVTMVQMASAFSSLINGGNYYKPHVVKKITDENGNLIEENKGELLKQTLSKDTCNMVKQYPVSYTHLDVYKRQVTYFLSSRYCP